MSDVFAQIEQEIPRLRRHAQSLVRDPSSADDLVQDCLAQALAKSHLWQEGTDLRAWLFTIQHSQYANTVRRSARESAIVESRDTEPSLLTPEAQFIRLELRDLERALALLPAEQRQVLLLVGMEGLRYEDVAKVLGVPVGTVSSRLSRGRDALWVLMDETDKARAERRAETVSQ